MFDVPLAERASESFQVDLPDPDEEWTIGAIVGPSGSGKTTIARAAFGDAFYEVSQWPSDRAVIDGFGEVPVKQITSTLTAVGFSSPPSWLKPYHVLSNGEKFRCDLARALLLVNRVVVFDEFTSVVDRTVAKVGSAAIARSLRAGLVDKRFVAVTCHYDLLEWLEPDWVLDMATGHLARGRLRRPTIVLQVVGCRQSMWRLFARHHYLSSELPRASSCFMALWNDEPVAFCATTGMYGRVGRKRIARVVVLPDYQGLGIGMRLVERVCEFEASRGFRTNLTASHPAVIAHCARSIRWNKVSIKQATGGSHQISHGQSVKTAVGRSVVSFEFLAAASMSPFAPRK